MFAKEALTVTNKTALRKKEARELAGVVKKEFPGSELQLDKPETAKLNGEKAYWFSVFEGADPLFIHERKKAAHLIPTVYALARCPSLLPLMVIQELVVKKLERGDKLFRPGLLATQGEIRKKSLVSFVTRSGRLVGIGRSQMGGAEIEASSSGLLANPLHMVGDELFRVGSRVLQVEQEDEGEDEREEDEDAEQQEEKNAVDEFLIALHRVRLFKLELPLLLSTFSAQCFEGRVKEMAGGFKKISKLAKYVEKETGAITLEEPSKGVLCIASIDRQNEQLRAVPVPEVELPDEGPEKGLKFETLYKVNPSVCKRFGFTGEPITMKELRAQVLDRLQPIEKGRAPEDNELVAMLKCEGTVKAVMRTMVDKKTNPWHRITFLEDGTVKEGKGAPPKLKLKEERRGGNKIVTLIHNVEALGLRAEHVRSYLSHKFAASASLDGGVITLQGKRAKDAKAALSDEFGLKSAHFS